MSESPPFRQAVVESLVPLDGLSAGAALYPWGGRLVAVRDDAWELAYVDPHSGACETWPFRGEAALAKADFRAVAALTPDYLVLFGSGAMATRQAVVLADLAGRRLSVLEAAPLYAAIGEELGETPNLVAAVRVDQYVYVAHRSPADGTLQWLVLPAWWLTHLDPERPAPIPPMVGSLPVSDSAVGLTDVAATERGLYLLGTGPVPDGGETAPRLGWCVAPGDPITWVPIRDDAGSLRHHRLAGLVLDPGACHAWTVAADDEGAAQMLCLALT